MKTLKNKKASTLVLATVIVMALSILAISVISVAGSQSYMGQAQVDKVKAEQLAKGLLYQEYMQTISDGNLGGTTVNTITLDGKDFSSKVVMVNDGSGPLGTNPVTITVNF